MKNKTQHNFMAANWVNTMASELQQFHSTQESYSIWQVCNLYPKHQAVLNLSEMGYLSRGVLAKSNGELVDKVVQMAKLLGREIATPADARRILSLK